MKTGIIAASFGTSHKDARKKSLDTIENEISQYFGNALVTKAYTSNIIINKILEIENFKVNTILDAINELISAGVDEIYVQPLHMIQGHEFDKLKNICEAFTEIEIPLHVGQPLLCSKKDCKKLVSALESNLPNESMDQAVILVGHGTSHEANSTYETLFSAFKEVRRNVHIVNAEGQPDIDSIEYKLKDMKKAIITPLMVVAGEHASNDIAGPDSSSIKSKLESLSLEVTAQMEGLGENPLIRQLYIEK